MKIYAVIGLKKLWDDFCDVWAVCATEEVAKSFLEWAQKEEPELQWRVSEWQVQEG